MSETPTEARTAFLEGQWRVRYLTTLNALCGAYIDPVRCFTETDRAWTERDEREEPEQVAEEDAKRILLEIALWRKRDVA